MAKVESFDGLISSIQEAFLSVNRMAENQHLESLEEFLEDDGSPKIINVKYPVFNDDGMVEYKDLAIPALCVVPLSTLKLSEITVDFKVKLAAEISLKKDDIVAARDSGDAAVLKAAAEGKAAPSQARRQLWPRRRSGMGFIPGYRQKKDDSYANITLKFNAEEPPEGMLRIRDEMIKILP